MLSLHLGYKVQDRNELYPENLGISTILLTIINLLLNLSLKSKIMFIFSDYKTFPAIMISDPLLSIEAYAAKNLCWHCMDMH